jgi:hypothetical protein
MSQPHAVSNDFERSPRADNHNQSRQHELTMEAVWVTQDCWFRLATTLAGTHVTDCWKLVKFHVSAYQSYSTLTTKDFAEILNTTLRSATGYKITLCRPNVMEGQYPYLWPNRNGSSKKSASTSPVTLAAPKRAEAGTLTAIPNVRCSMAIG